MPAPNHVGLGHVAVRAVPGTATSTSALTAGSWGLLTTLASRDIIGSFFVPYQAKSPTKAHFLSLTLYTPDEVAVRMARRLLALRLTQNMKRATLAERAGVSASTVKRFESTGQITLENLLKLAVTLGCLDQFDALFDRPPVTSIAELERRAEARARKRGRQ